MLGPNFPSLRDYKVKNVIVFILSKSYFLSFDLFFEESKVILYLNFTKSTNDILTRNLFPKIVYVK